MRPRYYYPEDVVKSPDGKCVTVGYRRSLSSAGIVQFMSILDVRFTEEELEQFDELYFRIWESARMRVRDEATKEVFRVRYPYITEENERWDWFLAEGNEESISGFHIWEERLKAEFRDIHGEGRDWYEFHKWLRNKRSTPRVRLRRAFQWIMSWRIRRVP